MNTITRASSKHLRQEQTNTGKMVRKRNRKLQRKISFIIATDLVCWLPVTVASCLHSGGVIDATPYYSFISIVFLPINSVINPVVYDHSMTEKMVTFFKMVATVVMARRCGRKVNQDPNITANPDEMEMKILKSPPANNNTGSDCNDNELNSDKPCTPPQQQPIS